MKKLPFRIIGLKPIDILLNMVLFIVGLWAIGFFVGTIFGLIRVF